jgi:cytochrome c-type biogenesis protein CcmH
MLRILVLALGVALVPFATWAVEPDEMLKDPVLEARAREISRQLRCVVCQNENIDTSNAGIARDLRLIVRERLVAGDSNDDVITFVRDKYGDFVLMSPPLMPSTYLLWFGPPLMALLGLAGGGALLMRNRRERHASALSDAEEGEFSRMLQAREQDGVS